MEDNNNAKFRSEGLLLPENALADLRRIANEFRLVNKLSDFL